MKIVYGSTFHCLMLGGDSLAVHMMWSMVALAILTCPHKTAKAVEHLYDPAARIVDNVNVPFIAAPIARRIA